MTQCDHNATDATAYRQNAHERLGIVVLLYFTAAASAFAAVFWPGTSILAVIVFGYLAVRWCIVDARILGRSVPPGLAVAWPVWPVAVAVYLVRVRESKGVMLGLVHFAGLGATGLVALCLAGYSPFGLTGQMVATASLLFAVVAAMNLFWVGITRPYRSAVHLAVIMAASMRVALLWDFVTANSSREYMRDITGLAFTLGSPEHWYDTGASFNGDGYRIEEYRLRSDVANQFRVLLPKMASRPRLSANSQAWHVEHWKTGRPHKADMPYIDFALRNSIGSIGGPALFGQAADADRMRKRALESLEKPTSHFAYYYNADSSSRMPVWVRNVHLFIIDAPAKRLFRIDFDT